MGPLSAQVEGVLFLYKSAGQTIILFPRQGVYLCGMGRIMGIDFGLKRTGISVTDPEQIIVQGLDTKDTAVLMSFLTEYVKHEKVDKIVVGYPFVSGRWGDPKFREALDQFIASLRKTFITIPVDLHDERYTSVHARELMARKGLKKKQREDKALLDKTSAILILQEYLGHI